MNKTVFKLSALSAVLLSSAAFAQSIPDIGSQADKSRFVIKVDKGAEGLAVALSKKHGGVVKLEADGFIAVSFPGQDLGRVKGLLNNPKIQLVEQDVIRTVQGFADDTTNPHITQTRSYVVKQAQSEFLPLNTGASRKVCVIDSGLDGAHPDFEMSSIQGTDDLRAGAWDVAGGAHGTHVAGIIAAADNAIGTLGVAPGTPLHIVKVFDGSGWAYSSTLAMAAQTCINAGADIINMSLGGGTPSSTEASVFDSFAANGGLSIAAAGNAGNDTRIYPAGYPSVMMVGAADANNQIAAFSQHPTCLTGTTRKAKSDDGICVEVAGGGVRVMSAYPVENGVYGYMSGTSMATPVVSGVAASVWSHFPQCTGEQIRQALKMSAVDAGSPGKDVYFGYGLVNLATAYDYLSQHGCSQTVVEPEPTPCRGKKCG